MYSSLYVGTRRDVSIVNTTSGVGIDVKPYRILDEHNLIYVLDGTVDINQDGVKYKLNKDDIMFLHAGHSHFASAPDKNSKIFYLHFQALEEDKLLLSSSPTEVHNDKYIVLKDHFRCSNTQTIKRIFDEMISIRFFMREDYTFKKFGLSAHLDILLYELRCDLDSTNFLNSNIVGRATRRIASHPAKFYTLEEMANLLDCSKKTLEKNFKIKTGYTFHQYQLYKKIEQVSIILKSHPNIPLKALADQHGFYDEFHLSKSFKKFVGVSPKEYRLLLKTLQQSND